MTYYYSLCEDSTFRDFRFAIRDILYDCSDPKDIVEPAKARRDMLIKHLKRYGVVYE